MTRPTACPLLPLALALSLTATAPASGQQPGPVTLRLSGVLPAGARSSVTQSWGTLAFTVENLGDQDRDARVVVSYPDRPDRRYARDVWSPARSSVSSWLPVGPAGEQPYRRRRDLDVLFYDRTGGDERLLLPPGEERARSRAVLYRKRELTTAIALDATGEADDPTPELTEGSPGYEAVLLARSFREAAGASEHVGVIPPGTLPLTPGAFEGIDQLILASGRLTDDPAGLRAVRHWLEQGGRVWAMLDRVDVAALAPLLGDECLPAVVDRTGLTSLRLRRRAVDASGAEARTFEDPVEMVRLTLPGAEQVVHVAEGWPASFVVPVGRGRLLCTTLGPRAWHRPRTRNDQPSPFRELPNLPVAVAALEDLVTELKPDPEAARVPAEALAPLITGDIGYSVPDRATAALVLGAYVAALLGIGLLLRRSGRPEWFGWLTPLTAAATAAVFLVLANASRRSVPPTVAAAEVAEVAPGSGEAATRGLFLTYRPDSGPAELSTSHGGLLELDESALEGQERRLVFTDADAWHWEGLALPAGVRGGPFSASADARGVTAVARFGPLGVEGRLASGPYRGAGDAVLLARSGSTVGVRLAADGAFATGASAPLPPGQYLADAVLSDRQQRRQEAYRALLGGAALGHLAGRDALLAWAEPPDAPFRGGPEARSAGTALLVVPLEWERTPPGTDVTVPGAFTTLQRFVNGRATRPTLESSQPTEMHLRFQVPATAVPLRVAQAVLHARLRAPGRRFAVAGLDGETPVPVLAVDSPLEPVRAVITDQRLLRLDADGGLHLRVSVGGRRAEAATVGGRKVLLEDVWKIESLSLEIYGRTPGGR